MSKGVTLTGLRSMRTVAGLTVLEVDPRLKPSQREAMRRQFQRMGNPKVVVRAGKNNG